MKTDLNIRIQSFIGLQFLQRNRYDTPCLPLFFASVAICFWIVALSNCRLKTIAQGFLSSQSGRYYLVTLGYYGYFKLKEDAHVLIVDDDKDIRDLLHEFLKRRGMRVSIAHDGEEMHDVMSRTAVDLIILDVMLPGKSGIEICPDIRRHSRVPIIMLTAIADAADKILGLEIGADDYLAKPFDPRELLARIRAVLRRLENNRAPSRPVTHSYRFAGWTLDCARRRLTSPSDVRVELTTAEFNLLEAFVKSSQHILSRDQLMEMAGNQAVYGYDRSVDILISRLRRKLNDDSRSPKLILTIRGGGYQFGHEVEVE